MRSTHVGRAATVLAAALVATACGGGTSDEALPTTAPTVVATTAPAAPVVQAISGSQVDFGDALTQDTVLWFWAPW